MNAPAFFHNKGTAGAAILLLMVCCLLLRVAALDSDAYTRLSWSSALLTDEGFYLHNARNCILFGHERTDEFNNALIMPTLHFVQIGVFRLFGVGVTQARLISVVCSLLTLWLFFLTLRRVFGARVAWIGTLFLGLDHVNLLQNRLALMDTPGALVLVAAFAAFACGAAGGRHTGKWLALSGGLLGLAYTTRGLTAFFFPVPFFVLGWQRRWRDTLAVAGGMALALTLYAVVWWMPHRAELAQVNHYYLRDQLIPHSFRELRLMATFALFGDLRGYASYLFRHTPVVFVLCLLALAAWPALLRRAPDNKLPGADKATRDACTLTLGLWLLIPLLIFTFVRYAPSRYYVLFYPAMAGIAALTLESLPVVWQTALAAGWKRAVLGGFLTYHLALTFLPHSAPWTPLALWGLALAGALCAVAMPRWLPIARRETFPRTAMTLLLLFWAIINAGWLTDWLTHLQYTQRDADHWLATNLPSGSVLIGDAAPGVCLDNRFLTVPVIPKLCNDTRPVERFAPAPRTIVILEGKRNETWWRTRYPQFVTPRRCLKRFAPLVGFAVSVYPATE